MNKKQLAFTIGLSVLALLVWYLVSTGGNKKDTAQPTAQAPAVKSLPATLPEIQSQLAGRTPEELRSLILSWLDSGRDAKTGQGFKLAADGSLTEAPTLRTFLLDQLIRADRAAAAGYAQKILAQKTSADEWALALRAYALGNTNGEASAFLQQKFQELLHEDNWRNDPSVGYLEAFDVAVYSRDTGLAPEFSAMLADKTNRATAHAAYLTMDRLVQAQPDEMLSQLQAHPEWMAANPSTRADFFARADVRADSERTVLESYLLNPSLSPAELQQFAGVFPNANYMVSHNLLTGTFTPNGADLAARDRAALQTVNDWLADPRFESRRGQLQTIKQRLEMFVQQAGK